MQNRPSNPESRTTPDFWNSAPTPAAPDTAPAVDADQKKGPRRTGKGWIWTSFTLNGLAVVGAIVLPHFMAVLAIVAAGCAWNGMRLSRDGGTPRLGIGALVASIVVFVGCVIYTIVIVQLGFAYWESLP